jgi:CMP-N,N'-diacetyllegionaminic acid synthase
MSKNIVAMVPVRAGSVRVSDKNIRSFAGTCLLELKLRLLSHLEGLSNIIVSTDCEKSAEIAFKAGAEVQWRDLFYTGSNVTNDLHWRHIAETSPGDAVFLAQVTSPLLKVSSMQRALNEFLNRPEVDSINSVSAEKKFLWKNDKPINYDINVTPKSQDLPNIVSLNFAITIIDRLVMIDRKNVVGNKPKFIELDKLESMDIDDLTDFKIAEVMYKELGDDWLLS